MIINIGTMKIEGFGPIKKITFNWDQQGLNIIQAPNGSGKSKLISALCWIFYGKTLSGSVTPWKNVQTKFYKGTMGYVYVRVDKQIYKIIRCKDYTGTVLGAKGKNRLVILKEEENIYKEIPLDKGKIDKQKYIDELLGYSFDLFKNSIIFGQKLKKLIVETGPNKKKVLDEAFEIAYIAKAKKLGEEELTKIKLEIYRLEPLVEHLIERVKSEESLLESLEKENKETEKNNKILRKTFNEELREMKELLEDYEKSIGTKESLKGRIDDLSSKITNRVLRNNEKYKALKKLEIENESDKKTWEKLIEDDIKSIEELKDELLALPKNCPRCGKPFTKEDQRLEKERIKKNINAKELNIQLSKDSIKEADEGIISINSRYASLNKKVEEVEILKKEKSALENKVLKLSELEKLIPKLKKNISDKESQIESLNTKSQKNNIPKLQASIVDLKKELEPREIEYLKLKRKRKLYLWAINGPLSNSGIKTFIFDTMLEKVNERLKYYETYIGFDIQFSVDLESKNKDIDTFIIKEDEICPYEDLSGGQQQTVDIATIFAIHDIVTENKFCNLLIMDEIFESLDTTNIELVTELIQEKAKGKCLFLVTHRAEFIPTHSNIIRINYKDGISSVAI